MRRIRVGQWHDPAAGPMVVVSGPVGRQRVHYTAPPTERLGTETSRFLESFDAQSMEPVLTAGVAHLWFVTIHPFENGNGRIARACGHGAGPVGTGPQVLLKHVSSDPPEVQVLLRHP